METIRVLQVDAFTTEPLAGNAAGVVPDAAGLGAERMEAIARELSVSETAFLSPGDDADYRIRYFTPRREVDRCGHATVGAAVHLREAGVVDDAVSFETNTGVLEVEFEGDGTVWIREEPPTVREVDVGHGRLADALGIDRAALEGIGADLPPAVASTGLPFLIVPVAYLSDLGSAEPALAAVEELSADVEAIGVYAFTFDTLAAEATLHGRAFAPAAGIAEDPVTGTASGAVAAYLDHVGAFEADAWRADTGAVPTGPTAGGELGVDAAPDVRIDVDGPPAELRLEQGHFLDRPGTVRVRPGSRPQVGGRGVVALDGRLAIPDATDEDILEV